MEGYILNNKFFEYSDNFSRYRDKKSILILGDSDRGSKLFTIAIPTFKRPELLENALKSALNQVDIDDYEIVIVDNDYNSSNTEKIIDKYSNDHVYYFKNEENIGMFGNWNRCIELAKGKYITILNDDDWLSSNYLSCCMNYLNPEIDGLYFRNNVIDLRHSKNVIKKERYLILKRVIRIFSKKRKKLTLFDLFLGNKSAGTLGVLMRTEYLKKLGGYNPEYFPSSDYVLHANYSYKYNVSFINEKLNYYRIAENESSKQETLEAWEYLDNDIRNYFINVIGKNKGFLMYLNKLIQENRVEGLVKTWHYKTDKKRKHNLFRGILNKIISIKYYLNI